MIGIRPLARAFDFFSIVFFAGSMVLSEVVLSQRAAYIYSTNLTLFITIAIFASLSLGSMAGLHPFCRRLSFGSLHLINSICFVLSAVGIGRLPAWWPIWGIISFFGAGIFSTQIFMRIDLKKIILAIGAGSIVVYASLNGLYSLFAEDIVLAAVLLPAMGTLFCRPTTRLLGVFFIIVGSTLWLQALGAIECQGYQEVNLPGFVHALRVRPTKYTPLILTDVFWAPRDNSYYFTINGSRFSPIIHWSQRRLKMGNTTPSPRMFDTPYLIRRPSRVLIIGSAGGANVSRALKFGVDQVYALDVNPEVFALMTGPMRGWSGGLYLDPRVVRVIDEGRHFIETTQQKFDLIVLQGVQTGTHNDILNGAVLESFLFTREALAKMWELLNSEGMLYFEEYKSLDSGRENSVSLLGSVGRMAEQSLNLADFDRHYAFFEYPSEHDNVGEKPGHYTFRQSLVLSRAPIDDKLASVVSRLNDSEGGFRRLDLPRANEKTVEISDNRPFFIRQSVLRYTRSLVAILILTMAIATWLIFRRNGSHKQKLENQTFFLMGMAYICFTMSIFGPATLLLGPPEAAIPVVYFTLFFFSVVGGLWALRPPGFLQRHSLMVTALYLALIPLLFGVLKPFILPIGSVMVRAVFLIVVLGIAAGLMELPYISMLNKRSERDRAVAYFIGKTGVVVGALLGLFLEFRYGFCGALCGAIALYLLSAGLNWHSHSLSR